MPLLHPRQRAEIENLPPNFKWEVLRRHPHYVRDWKLANLYWQTKNAPNDPDWRHVEAAVARMYLLTGWHDRTYPDPSNTAEQLQGGFLCRQAGSQNAHPLRAREAIEAIIWTLPPAVLHEVARILMGSAINPQQSIAKVSTPDGKDITGKYLQVQALTRVNHPELDHELSGNVSLNVNAPLRGISARGLAHNPSGKGSARHT
jgi:hypothetical protein